MAATIRPMTEAETLRVRFSEINDWIDSHGGREPAGGDDRREYDLFCRLLVLRCDAAQPYRALLKRYDRHHLI